MALRKAFRIEGKGDDVTATANDFIKKIRAAEGATLDEGTLSILIYQAGILSGVLLESHEPVRSIVVQGEIEAGSGTSYLQLRVSS